MIVCPWSNIKKYAPLIPGLEEAMQAVAEVADWTPRTIPLSNGNKILVQEYATKEIATQLVETHRKYLDVQYIVEGEELLGWAPTETLTPAEEYNEVKDKQMYSGHVDLMRIGQGCCYVVWPEDAHMPGVHLDKPTSVKKLVLKLKV